MSITAVYRFEVCFITQVCRINFNLTFARYIEIINSIETVAGMRFVFANVSRKNFISLQENSFDYIYANNIKILSVCYRGHGKTNGQQINKLGTNYNIIPLLENR